MDIEDLQAELKRCNTGDRYLSLVIDGDMFFLKSGEGRKATVVTISQDPIRIWDFLRHIDREEITD